MRPGLEKLLPEILNNLYHFPNIIQLKFELLSYVCYNAIITLIRSDDGINDTFNNGRIIQ
jgi:hypothetical protein